jgi:phosphatidylglycerophosphatase GEP4
LRAFGPGRVLIVSNTAGTRDDAAQLQAESVSHHLGTPVLLHAALKPSYACTAAVLAALPDVAPHELVVVGDRIFTDVVLAHRLAHPRTLTARIAARLGFASVPPPDASGPADAGTSAGDGLGEELSHVRPAAPLAVWTTGVWVRESMGMRCAEAWLVRFVERWVEGSLERRNALEARFVKRVLDGGGQGAEKAGRGWFDWVKGALPKLG